MPKGGKRQGAGRPKLPQVKKLITFRISSLVIERLKSEVNQSALVEYLLIEYFKEKQNEN